MNRIDGGDASRCGPAGPADRSGVSAASNRTFQDRLDQARARLRDGEGGSARRAEPGATEPHRAEPERTPPGRTEASGADTETALPSRVASDGAADTARSDGDDGLAAAPGVVPSAGSPGVPPPESSAGRLAADDRTDAGTVRVAIDAGSRREPRTVAPWFDRERHGASGLESSQASAVPFQAALARADAARPSADAATIAQWLIDRMALSDPADRSVTLSFPGSTVPVERIVLVREAGVLHLTVQPRPDGHERVAGAMRALEERLRERGLRVGSVRMS